MKAPATTDRCSFCGRSRDQAGDLVAGGGEPRGVLICHQCARVVLGLDAEEAKPPRPGADRLRRAAEVARTLTHLDDSGAARMVDVGAKAETERRAITRAKLMLSPDTVALVRDGRAPKGDVLATARVAGIQAAKRTSELIPLAHPLPLTHVAVDLRVEDDGIAIEATAATTAKTGVEMEALVAATVAGLTLYDMLKAVERGARLTDVRLVAKSGGRSGDLRLEE